jgi:hypothetical protein
MVSQDRLAILNTGSDEINVTLSLYYPIRILSQITLSKSKENV